MSAMVAATIFGNYNLIQIFTVVTVTATLRLQSPMVEKCCLQELNPIRRNSATPQCHDELKGVPPFLKW
jgi:hypothetical protein